MEKNGVKKKKMIKEDLKKYGRKYGDKKMKRY